MVADGIPKAVVAKELGVSRQKLMTFSVNWVDHLFSQSLWRTRSFARESKGIGFGSTRACR